MNKYSDLSSRILHSSASSSALAPKLIKSFRDSLNLNNITIYRYHSDSPEIRTSSPLCTKRSYLGISRFSLERNQKFSDVSDMPSPKKSLSIKLPEIQAKHSDFSNILEKIEKVVSPKTRLINILLKENESQRIVQPSNEYKFFKVICKGKRTPMLFRIKIIEGKLTSYVSFTEPQPTHHSNDRSYKISYFEVSEKNFSFKNECLHLGVKSHIFSIYKIIVRFGKFLSFSNIKNPKQTTIKIQQIKEESVIEEKEKGRNFIKENIDLIINSLSRSPEVRKSHDSWQSKVGKIKQKKKEIIQLKKNKAVEKLNRKKRLHEENLKNIEQAEESKNRRRLVAFWAGFITFQKTAFEIRKKIQENREIKLKLIKETIKARSIQRQFRKTLKFPDGLHVLLVFYRAMQTYVKISRPAIQKYLGKILISVISFSANKNELAHGFQVYYRRVTMVQKHIRDFLAAKDRRILSLIQLWNRMIDKSLFSKKSKRSRKKASLKVMTIPSNFRNGLLLDYYRGKWKELRERVRFVVSLLKPFKIVRRLVTGKADLICFNYYPSESEMIQLIHSSVRPEKD